jgi:type I restriction enzyme S subunit
MNAELLLHHFDRISEAPDAIPRLRSFILDLAVRGRLVEQDPKDEPASELLKRIQAEKVRLVREEKINLEKPPIPASPNDLSFELKPNWLAVRISQILVELQTGPFGSSLHQSDYQKGGIPVINPASIKNERLIPIDRMAVGPTTLKRLATFKLRAGDIVMARRGEMGRCAVVTDQEEGWLCGTGSLILRPPSCVCARFLVILIGSPFVREYLGGSAVGATMQNLNQSILLGLVVGLPPLAEQHRIVAKVDELMALCDRLEGARAERESRRDRLTEASIHYLNDGASAEASREHANFCLNDLTHLTARPDQIKQLRQTILNLAVRGRLVTQDPNDESTPEFLERSKLKTSDNEPFPIPPSWSWISVGQIGESRLGKMLDKAKNKGTPRRYLRNVNVRWFDFDLSDVLEMRFEDDEIEEYSLRKGDVLICEGGEPGRAAVWDEREEKIYFQKAIHRVRFGDGVDSRFFVNVVRESADSGRLSGYFTGVGIKHFTGKGLSSFIFPLPPLPEQHRIVVKVNELMTICDALEKQLSDTRTGCQNLLDSILHQALNGVHHKTLTVC